MYTLAHTHAHTHAHTDTDPPQSIPLFYDNFWTLADFQDSDANRAKLCFELLRHSPSQCIGLQRLLETRRCQSNLALYLPLRTHTKPFCQFATLTGHSQTLPGFRCHFSLTCFTTCVECFN